MTNLLILIPAYNEQAAIRQVVEGVRAVAPQADWLVVDDGSTDHTAQVAAAAGAIVLRHPFNLGIGGAVQTGLKFAHQKNYDSVIRLDGDGQHRPADISSIYAALRANRADVVVGSRFLDNKVKMPIPLFRRLGINLFALVVSVLTGQRATDTTSGFCGLNRRAVSLLVHYMPQDYPEVESRVIFHKAGLTVLEIPVRMRTRLTGVSSIDAWGSLYYALKVTVAVLITALKDISPLSEEVFYGHTDHSAHHRCHPQPGLAAGDGSVDSQT